MLRPDPPAGEPPDDVQVRHQGRDDPEDDGKVGEPGEPGRHLVWRIKVMGDGDGDGGGEDDGDVDNGNVGIAVDVRDTKPGRRC